MVCTRACLSPVTAIWMALWCLTAIGFGQDWSVEGVNPLEKVFKDASGVAHPSGTTLRLEAAANEFESGQFVIRTDQKLEDVTIEIGDLQNRSGGIRIDRSGIAWHFVGYVPVARNTTEARCGKHRDIPPGELLREAPFECPDPLIEQTRVSVEAHESQPVWVTVRVPRDTPAGLYEGEIRIITSAGTRHLPLELLVWDFSLPDERHLWLTNWFELGHIANAHGVKVLSEEFWQILGRYAVDLAEHHQNVIYTPWRLVQVFREEDGSLSFDYKDFDRFVNTFIEAGTAERIEIKHVARHGELGRAGKEIFLYEVTATDRKTGESVSLEGDEGMAALLKDLRNHLVEKGWFDRTIIHVADEPSFHNMDEWKAVSRFVHENMPGVKTIDAIGATGYEDALDIMVPLTRDVHTWYDDFKNAQQAGTELWFYTCCSPWGEYANRFLDYHLSKTRILHWMNYFTGTEGFLHWGLTYGWDDPFGPAPRYPPGDSHIIYPGSDGPMSSIRWEMLREGMEDYEYLWLLESRTRKLRSTLGVDESEFPADGFSREICGRLVRSLTDYETDPDVFYRVRRELAEEILRIGRHPYVLLATNPDPSTGLDTGPAVTKLYGFVEKGATIRVNGSSVPGSSLEDSDLYVDPETGAFQQKVRLSWTRPDVTIEVERDGEKKVFVRRFQVR